MHFIPSRWIWSDKNFSVAHRGGKERSASSHMLASSFKQSSKPWAWFTRWYSNRMRWKCSCSWFIWLQSVGCWSPLGLTTCSSFDIQRFMLRLWISPWVQRVTKVTNKVWILNRELDRQAASLHSDLVDSVEEGHNRKVPTWRKYSLQELIALYDPYLVNAAAVAVIAGFLYDPNMKAWLYSSLPKSYTGPLWFAGCLALEVHFVTFVAANVAPLFQIHVIFFDRINRALQRVALLALHM